MDKKYLAQIIATDKEGLQMISACVAGGKVKVTDIKYLKSNRVFLMSICYVNGSYEEKTSAAISIQDRGFNFSDGVYEVMSFSGNSVINFDKHVKRLSNSLDGLRIKKPLTNYKSLELILKKLIKLN